MSIQNLPQTKESFQKKFENALIKSKALPILLKEVIGEGENAWDSNPRFPVNEVNCLVWFQMVLSFAYAEGDDVPQVLDKVRYYAGNIAYGLRKHYVDHWLQVEPLPMRKIDLRNSFGFRSKQIVLDFERFKRFHGYPCALYREDVRTIETEYLTPEGFLRKVDNLPPGYYACLPVANELYLSTYGKNSGPMGYVHPSFLFVPEPRSEQSRGATVYHPSTITNKVIEFPAAEYVSYSVRIFEGYFIYGLEPEWNYQEIISPDKETLKIQKCESSLNHKRNILGL